jgi:hypothetical protein
VNKIIHIFISFSEIDYLIGKNSVTLPAESFYFHSGVVVIA